MSRPRLNAGPLASAAVDGYYAFGCNLRVNNSGGVAASMVLTLEPGLYVRPAEGVPEAFWHIGIRIEDDAIVTDTGCELITRDVPVAIDAIEALMRD